MEAGDYTATKGGRGRAWVLVKYWTGTAPRAGGAEVEDLEVTPLARLPDGETREAGETGETGEAGEAGEAEALPIRAASVPPPEGAHSSILIREGEAGFLAIARGKPVRGFSLGGKSFGGEQKSVDRGFEISPRVLRDGRIAVTLAPVFTGIGPAAGGRSRANEFRVKELAFGLAAEEGRAVMLSPAPAAKDEVVRALFGRAASGPQDGDRQRGSAPAEADEDAGAGPPASALWFQVEVVR